MSISSPLQLEQCNLTKLVIKTRQQGDIDANDESLADIKLTYNVRHHKTELKFWIPFNLSLTWPDDVDSTFEQLEIGFDGIFTLPPDTSEEAIQHYVPLLCLTNLYGIARGMLAQATGTCHGGPFYLSLINMDELLKSIANQEDAEEENESPYVEGASRTRSVTRRS